MPINEGELPLLLRQVTLVMRGDPVRAPENLVYSTAPSLSLGSDGTQYYVKGESDVRIVLAEAIAHSMARTIELPVPDFAIGFYSDSPAPVFASVIIRSAARNIEYWLHRRKINNLQILSRLIAFDTWLANNDRNLGNLLGVQASTAPDTIDLVAIDFEKSATIRSTTPSIEVPTINPQLFWPRGDLGTICREVAPWDPSAIATIASIPDSFIDSIVNAAVAAAGADISIADSMCYVLKQRKGRIESLAREVWT